MDIALLNQRITFQKNEVAADALGNRINEWEDFYSCAATIGGESGRESVKAGTVNAQMNISFTVRYCKVVNEIQPDTHRILFNDDVYNILAVDHMNYKNRSVKFLCEKVKR